jgi:hypothetical protein
MATVKKSNVTTVQSWKSSVSGTEIRVPSGNVCLARRVDLRVFLRRGIIPNSLMPFVNRAIQGKETKPEDIVASLGGNDEVEKSLKDMMDLMDMIVCETVVSPRVYSVPNGTESERDPDKLYVDEVEYEDKNFLFQWAVGGTSDLERFRTEQDDYVERLQPVDPSKEETG